MQVQRVGRCGGADGGGEGGDAEGVLGRAVAPAEELHDLEHGGPVLPVRLQAEACGGDHEIELSGVRRVPDVGIEPLAHRQNVREQAPGERALVVEGLEPGDELQEQHAEAVHIALGGDGERVDAHGVDVAARALVEVVADRRADVARLLVPGDDRPKVRDLGRQVRGQQHVRRLHVAVDDARGRAVVQVLQA